MSRRLENTRRKREKKSESELSIEAAREAGAKYAQDQLSGDYFHDWVWDQMSEAEEMRKRDPNSVIPLRGPDDYHEVARNMLQQLRWDIDRDLNPREVIGDASREEQQAFWDGLHDELRDPKVRSWLVEELIVPMHKEVTDGPRQRSLPGVQANAPRARQQVRDYPGGGDTLTVFFNASPSNAHKVADDIGRVIDGAVAHPIGHWRVDRFPGPEATPRGPRDADGWRLKYGPFDRNEYRKVEGALYRKFGNSVRVSYESGGRVDPQTWAEPGRRAPRRLHSGIAARGSRRRPSR